MGLDLDLGLNQVLDMILDILIVIAHVCIQFCLCRLNYICFRDHDHGLDLNLDLELDLFIYVYNTFWNNWQALLQRVHLGARLSPGRAGRRVLCVSEVVRTDCL